MSRLSLLGSKGSILEYFLIRSMDFSSFRDCLKPDYHLDFLAHHDCVSNIVIGARQQDHSHDASQVSIVHVQETVICNRWQTNRHPIVYVGSPALRTNQMEEAVNVCWSQLILAIFNADDILVGHQQLDARWDRLTWCLWLWIVRSSLWSCSCCWCSRERPWRLQIM